jgi:crotonobetainyl-CoA:carnitine CoA-transferase CaiB-like acyl-CoA transferase
MKMETAKPNGPLHGLKIVDLTAVIMGPYAMQILSDFGAEIIKIEAPEGDIMRHVGKNGDRGMGPIHIALNRGKRLVALDLKTSAGREALSKIVASADAFVHAMRPQAIQRLGLDYESVRAFNEKIVYCGAYGFSQDGPYRDDPAYDDMIQGLCGIADLGSKLAGEPRFFPTVIADKVCGLTLAHSLLAALIGRERTGTGQKIEVPMFETMVSFLLVEHLGDRTFGENEPPGYARVLSQLRKPHSTADGYVCALPYNDKNWRDFFRIVDRPDLLTDPRFASQNARSQNYEVLYTLLGSLLAERPTDYWLTHLRAASIPVAPVLGLAELIDDPHLRAVEMFKTVEHPSEGRIMAVRSPIQFSATPTRIGKPAGPVGADTRAVLLDHGYTEREIDVLATEGAVRIA